MGYLEWMHDNMATDMLARPLTLDSVKEVAAVWDMQSTISEDDKYIWWMDIGKMDKAKIKTMDPQEHLRYVVRYSHLIMFDDRIDETLFEQKNARSDDYRHRNYRARSA